MYINVSFKKEKPTLGQKLFYEEKFLYIMHADLLAN